MAWSAEGLKEQRIDFYADLTGVQIVNDVGAVVSDVAKANFSNISDGTAGAVTFDVNLTGADVGVSTVVKGYKFMKGATVLGSGDFDVANTAVTTLDTFKLTFTVNNA